MRYKKKIDKAIVVNIDQQLAISYVRQPSLVDSFIMEEGVHPETGETIFGVHNPLYMLFNQERIDRLGSNAIQQWIQSLDAANNSSLSQIRKKCSDDDLISMVKSRHIQHPCEFERYIEDLNSRADKFNSEVARLVYLLDTY